MQLERIAEYLSQYVESGGGKLPPVKEVLMTAIAMLLMDKILTVDEMRREAVKEHSVIIPWDYFPKEYRPGGYE